MTAALPARRPRYTLRTGRELSPRALCAVMNLPTLVTLALVLAYPIFYAAYLSFHRVALADLRRGIFPFVGFDNYRRLLTDPLFLLSLKHTVLFVAVSVGAEILLALAIALLISERSVWTGRATRVLILLPYAVPPIANGQIWAFLYSFDFGFLNRILFALGIIETPVNWTGDPRTALFALAVPYIWRTLPFAILLIHAALWRCCRSSWWRPGYIGPWLTDRDDRAAPGSCGYHSAPGAGTTVRLWFPVERVIEPSASYEVAVKEAAARGARGVPGCNAASSEPTTCIAFLPLRASRRDG